MKVPVEVPKENKMVEEPKTPEFSACMPNMKTQLDECTSRTDCIEKPLGRFFKKYGRYIAKHPYPFFVIPLILATCFGYGLRYFAIEEDIEYLVTPTNGRAKFERKLVNKYFHVDQEDGFLPERSSSMDGFADVIVLAKGGGNMLTIPNFNSLIKVESEIMKLSVFNNEIEYNFSKICATWQKKCIVNPIFLVLGRNASNLNKITLNYPLYGPAFLGHSLGNVTVNESTNGVIGANATRMTFFVKYKTSDEQLLANKWFLSLKNFLVENFTDSNIKVYYSASNSLQEQFLEATQDIIPKFAAPMILLILFSIFSCMMDDWVLSKPILAAIGVLYAGLSVITSFGFLSAMGIKSVSQAGLVPFLALGVGADNMYILISAWRRTDTVELLGLYKHQRVEFRMGETLKEAALSITITSLTNALAFGIGAITTFPTVEIFCLYTGLCMVFSYLFCMTFFCSAMVFSGWREEDNRHCFAFIKVHAKQEAKDSKSRLYNWFCAGGKVGRITENASSKETRVKFLPNANEENKEETESDHMVMRFFRNTFGPFLMNPFVKCFIFLTYVVYIGGAIYGCLHIRAGISTSKLSNENSYLQRYYQQLNGVFNKFGPAVQIVIEGELDYSDEIVQNDMENILNKFTNSTKFFFPPANQSWLRDYKDFLKSYPNPQKEDFNDILRYRFLKITGYDQYRLDLAFSYDHGNTKVIASRFYVQSLWHENTEDTMLEARKIAASITEYNVTIFHQLFVYFDQPVIVWQNTLQNIFIAIAVMFFVSVVFVPHPLCAIWVTITTASIEAGVLGFMTLWDVNVDFVSMTYLILCIGFSIDFSVHIAYGFISSKEKTGNKKAIDALYTLGYPIIQSGFSTILGVVFLCLSISYLFLSFFKTMLLVILFGVWHALFLLPTVLSVVYGICNECTSCVSDNDCGCSGKSPAKHIAKNSKNVCFYLNQCDCCIRQSRQEDIYDIYIKNDEHIEVEITTMPVKGQISSTV